MHTRKHGETTFHFNPDLSGKVVLRNESFDEIVVPADDLLAFVVQLMAPTADELKALRARFPASSFCDDLEASDRDW